MKFSSIVSIFLTSLFLVPATAVIDEAYVSKIREAFGEGADLSALLQEIQNKIADHGGFARMLAEANPNRESDMNGEEEHEARRLAHRRGFFYKTIEDFVDRNDRLATLELLLVAAGLDDALDDLDETYTLFAPTNKAFAALPISLVEFLLTPEPANQLVLISVLIYHLIPAFVYSSDIPVGVTEDIETVLTVVGEGENDSDTLVIEKGCYWTWHGKYCAIVIDGVAKVVRADIKAKNGVIHIIDAVLVPPSLREAVSAFF